MKAGDHRKLRSNPGYFRSGGSAARRMPQISAETWRKGGVSLRLPPLD